MVITVNLRIVDIPKISAPVLLLGIMLHVFKEQVRSDNAARELQRATATISFQRKP